MRKVFKEFVEEGKKFVIDYYTYSTTFTAVASSASQTQLINIEADADFVCEKISYFADEAGASQTDSSRVIPLCTLSIQDSGSGRNLQNQPVTLSSIAGIGELPFILPTPRVFRANSTINFTINNFSAATTYAVIQVSLVGYKKFFMGQA